MISERYGSDGPVRHHEVVTNLLILLKVLEEQRQFELHKKRLVDLAESQAQEEGAKIIESARATVRIWNHQVVGGTFRWKPILRRPPKMINNIQLLSPGPSCLQK